MCRVRYMCVAMWGCARASVSPLLTEPHFLFGSLKLKRRVNRIIPASLYFKSIRVSDEETDGGGVYGRNIKLPHYHKDKLVACVGDTLVHIILKNDSMDNRQDLLDVLMNIGSFSEESVKALNSSNRTPLEEMNPPFFFKIPAYSYTYNAQVRWRALKAHVSEKFHTAADPTIGKLANDITATPEDYDKALHAWNHRSLCWVDVNDKDKDKQSLNKEKDELAPSLLCNQPDSIQINKIKPIPFVDGGVFRGCMIGHKRVQKREYPFLNKLKKNIKDSYEEQFQLTINSLLFCIEWDHKVKIIPRWQIVPEPELTCHVIKRRKWYNGLIFYNQHPLLVRNYIIKYSRYEINELKIKQEIINQQNLKDAFVKRSLLIHNHNVKMKELKQMKILKQFSQLDSENNSLENRLGNDSDEGKGTQLQLQLQDESQSSNRESVLENNEDNNNTNHTNHHKHTNEDADVSLTQDYEDGSHSVVVLGPVSRNDARRFPPISNHLLTSELLIVRKAEENPFLDDWQYEVFSPESLTDISTTMGKAVNSSSSTGKSNTRSYDWFHKEIEQLREAKKSLLERQELERKNSANQKSFDDKLPMSSFDRSGRMSMDQLISSYAF
mmetsp:Transcript_20541/g.26725  ORF Transcript_20541/g.26725 Transcript_20541/m.26725 type:complete len:610 (+) Transcript_20541:20-1849(+)